MSEEQKPVVPLDYESRIERDRHKFRRGIAYLLAAFAGSMMIVVAALVCPADSIVPLELVSGPIAIFLMAAHFLSPTIFLVCWLGSVALLYGIYARQIIMMRNRRKTFLSILCIHFGGALAAYLLYG